MKQGLIGVIVPVYKVEKYIAECIESILAQTYTNFRLILVDDGTPDNAGKICDEYAKRDQRITVIHQENAGVTRARARGVEEAKDCEFITFVDGDDTLTSKALNELLIHCNNNTDIVVNETISNKSRKRLLKIEDFRKEIISGKNCSLWGKLFRRHIIDNKTFSTSKNIYVGEDLLTNLRIAFNTKSDVILISENVYNYRNNSEGCINTFIPTLEYEEIFQQTLLRTINEYDTKEKYAFAHIKRRVVWWDQLFGYRPKCPIYFNSNYHKELLSDIAKYRYPINKIEYLLLRTRAPFIRYLLVFIRKVLNYIKI